MSDDELETLAYYFFKGEDRIDVGNGTTLRIDFNKCQKLMEFNGIVGLDYNNDCVVRRIDG